MEENDIYNVPAQQADDAIMKQAVGRSEPWEPHHRRCFPHTPAWALRPDTGALREEETGPSVRGYCLTFCCGNREEETNYVIYST